jgi:hypothetical protein
MTTVRYATHAITEAVSEHTEQLAADGTTRQQFVALTVFKRDLEGQLRRIKSEIASREQAILEQLADAGEDGYKLGGRTVYITRKVWARAASSKPDACQALKAAGLGDYVEEGFNTNSLSAYFREQREAQPLVALDSLLPEQLRDHIALTEDHQLGLR